jgi:hypothetical protein
MRIRWNGTNGYASYSTNGSTYSTEVLRNHSTGNPTVLAFISYLGTGTLKVEQASFGPGTLSGGLEGYWDGSQIVPLG